MQMSKGKVTLYRKGDCLCCGQILRIADYVADQFDLPRVDHSKFRREYGEAFPQPFHCKRGKRVMWVDKYYVAYALDDGVLHYVYNTRVHICEEHRNWLVTSKERGQEVSIPAPVLRCFRKSGYEMFVAGHSCWVEKNFLEKIFGKPTDGTKGDISM